MVAFQINEVSPVSDAVKDVFMSACLLATPVDQSLQEVTDAYPFIF